MYCQRCGTQISDESSFCNSCGLDVTNIGRPDVPQQESAPDEIEHVREALKDEYEILSELGRGGMAVVFRAHEKGLDREVAVKVLPASMGFDAEFVERFQREARTAAKLEHPSIIPIYRVGKSGRVIYFVMKFLRGKSLAELVDHGSLDTGELRRLLSETASALGYAHKHGIVHRDIKPDNILLDDTGRAIITDFGIAKAATGAKLTGTGMAIGTPYYMSPEQARATPLDGRSDIYSLGVCAYQCLTGKVPFDGTDAFSIGYKHITEDIPIPELETDAQRDLFGVITKMMAKEPDDRFQTAEELCLALDSRNTLVAADTVSTDVTTPLGSSSVRQLVSAVDAAASVTPTTPMPKTDFKLADEGVGAKKAETEKKSRGGVLIAAALLVIVAGGGGGGYVYYNNFFDPGTNPAASRAAATSEGIQIALLSGASPGGTDPVAVDGAVPEQTQADTSANTTDSTASGIELEVEDSVEATLSVEVAATTGTLFLRGMPIAARVRLDGEAAGRTLELSPGSHLLEVTHPGRVDFSREVEVAVGDFDTLLVALTRVPVAARPPVRAAANCAGPGDDYNAGNICFDFAPRAIAASLVPLTDAVQGTPSPVILWVNVSPDGSAAEVRTVGESQDPMFSILALAFARDMRYNPAQKNGRPVEGWFQLQLVAASR